jgi:hypothetical protein
MSVDVGMRQSLIEAGLVDPESGSFLSAPNFGEPLPDDAPRDPLPNEDESAPQEQPTQKPASEPQVQPAVEAPNPKIDTSPAPSSQPLETDPNRLGDQSDPVRAEYDKTVATLEQQAREAFLIGRTAVDEQGNRVYTDEQLAQMIGPQFQHATQQAYLAAVMQRMQPVAKRAAAEQIAKEYGVQVDDVINEESPVAMRTRAKTIADLERDGRFERRKNAGTDTAEGSRSFNNAVPEGLDKLSPQQKIYAGLARGDR